MRRLPPLTADERSALVFQHNPLLLTAGTSRCARAGGRRRRLRPLALVLLTVLQQGSQARSLSHNLSQPLVPQTLPRPLPGAVELEPRCLQVLREEVVRATSLDRFAPHLQRLAVSMHLGIPRQHNGSVLHPLVELIRLLPQDRVQGLLVGVAVQDLVHLLLLVAEQLRPHEVRLCVRDGLIALSDGVLVQGRNERVEPFGKRHNLVVRVAETRHQRLVRHEGRDELRGPHEAHLCVLRAERLRKQLHHLADVLRLRVQAVHEDCVHRPVRHQHRLGVLVVGVDEAEEVAEPRRRSLVGVRVRALVAHRDVGGVQDVHRVHLPHLGQEVVACLRQLARERVEEVGQTLHEKRVQAQVKLLVAQVVLQDPCEVALRQHVVQLANGVARKLRLLDVLHEVPCVVRRHLASSYRAVQEQLHRTHRLQAHVAQLAPAQVEGEEDEQRVHFGRPEVEVLAGPRRLLRQLVVLQDEQRRRVTPDVQVRERLQHAEKGPRRAFVFAVQLQHLLDKLGHLERACRQVHPLLVVRGQATRRRLRQRLRGGLNRFREQADVAVRTRGKLQRAHAPQGVRLPAVEVRKGRRRVRGKDCRRRHHRNRAGGAARRSHSAAPQRLCHLRGRWSAMKYRYC
eukprot:Rhum_TRINITY_DN3645_c0_g2::Rhum_TRINITY_DN3645_c0_g2_i1::g.11558::m.11558